jgi:hypothetical protein
VLEGAGTGVSPIHLQCSLVCLGGTPLGFKPLRLLLASAFLGKNPLLLRIKKFLFEKNE